MDQHVTIPADFFLREAKAEYFDYRTRLVQELLQNSLDAGATRIDLTFDDAKYSCEDNGVGMTKERMVAALLTMGGSAKETGSTGGFGAAKKLLLFAHQDFTIHSNDTLVLGCGLDYKFAPCVARKGTLVSGTYSSPDSWNNMRYKAKQLLEKCNFKGTCKVYVDGELFTDYVSVPETDMASFGTIFASKKQMQGEDYVWVLHNGLFMFERYIQRLNRRVVVLVTRPSVEMFTQNRDGFTGQYRTDFDALMNKMAIDKQSIVKPKQRKFVVEGIDAFIAHIAKAFTLTPTIQAAINSVRMNASNLTIDGVLVAAMVNVQTNSRASTADKAIAESIVTYVKNQKAGLKTDFHFDLADSTYRKVPEKFLPNVGKPKYTMLAKLWKVAVRNVLAANEMNQNFTIGFTLSSTASATYSRKEDTSCYLVNPLSTEIDEGTKQERVMSLLTIAVHEVVHSLGFTSHDEDFVRKFHDLLVPTLTKGLTWRQLTKEAKAETV